MRISFDVFSREKSKLMYLQFNDLLVVLEKKKSFVRRCCYFISMKIIDFLVYSVRMFVLLLLFFLFLNNIVTIIIYVMFYIIIISNVVSKIFN